MPYLLVVAFSTLAGVSIVTLTFGVSPCNAAVLVPYPPRYVLRFVTVTFIAYVLGLGVSVLRSCHAGNSALL
mgnify:CR=1 FL=1